jgi:predicted RND superfamily exporter protein
VDRFESYIDPDFRTCNVMTRLGQNGDGLLGTAGLKHILKRISEHLSATLPAEYAFKITGYPLMLIKSVDYIVNGQVQSLLLTLLVVGFVVLLLLKDIRAAVLSLIPMSVAVIINFGIMGWFGIHLDIATSIIAAITIGIAVDDTIHYVHRFNEEILIDGNYLAAMRRSHDSVGRAMYYTSITIIIGFSILTLSNFIPTIYFGLFTGLAMLIAMFANLTLLALLLIIWRPKNSGNDKTVAAIK